MKLDEYKLVFVALGLIGVLLFSSPILGLLANLPAGEEFSEIYLLGPGRLAENYPSSIEAGLNYSVYVGVGNHMVSSAYYVVYVKLKNQTEPFPNATSEIPSPISPLYEYRFLVSKGASWEAPVVFSVSDASVIANQLVIGKLIINGNAFEVNKAAIFDVDRAGFPYELFMELWIFNVTTGSIQFANRFVTLKLNFAVTS